MLHRKFITILACLALLVVMLAACTPAATPTPGPGAPANTPAPGVTPAVVDTPAVGDRPHAGTTVTIFGAAQDEQVRLFQESMRPFEERTGINIVYEGSGDFETIALVRAEAGDPYDIYNFPQPGLMADMARSGFLVPLDGFLSQDYMRTKYDQSWIDLGTVDGQLYGVWHNADVKSLVWYPRREFEAAGYTVPQTWDELLALSDQIVADGGTPWCIGIESSGATGWVGTDWVEDIMLRTQPPEAYDRWVTGDLPFNSPEVRNAFETMGEIWFNPDYVLGGTTGILTTFFGDSPTPMFDNPPSCYMHRQASFIVNFFPEGTVVGEDADYFYLPPIDPAQGRPVLGSGSIMSMGRDTEAIRMVMEYLTTGESTRAEVEAGIIVSPHLDSDLGWYPDDATRGFAEILLGADTFRFDGSDLMPGAVGAGSFWTGIVDYVSGVPLDTVLQQIDDSWPD
jgi:alpha-glucoside transport system substrate-binding protein